MAYLYRKGREIGDSLRISCCLIEFRKKSLLAWRRFAWSATPTGGASLRSLNPALVSFTPLDPIAMHYCLFVGILSQ